MKLFRVLPLLLLPALSLGATCVTRVDQKGPAGPWVGEVVNTGDTLQPDVHVYGWFQDADGRWVGGLYAETCPFDLLPEQRGYFFGPAADSQADLVLPFSLAEDESYSCQQHSLTTGVHLRIISMSDDHKSALVEARNDSQNTYYDLGACGVSFAPSGEAEDVAKNPELPSRILRPGDRVQFSLNFHSPVTGHVDLAVKSAFGTYDTVLDSSHFEVTSSKVIQTDSGPQLQVVGEVRNDLPVDLDAARFEAFRQSSPDVRAWGSVGSFGYPSDVYPGNYAKNEFLGTGFVPANGKAPFVFSLPLGPHDSTSVEFAGLVASKSSSAAVPVAITDVSGRQFPDFVEFDATVTNPFDNTLQLFYCIDLRDSGGKLKGASCQSSCGILPGNNWNVSARFDDVEPTDSVDVAEYVRPSSCHVVPPSDPGPPPCGPIPGPNGTPISPD